MLTPQGQSAKNMDKIMLLGEWAKYLAGPKKNHNSSLPPMIFAGMGNPTCPLRPKMTELLVKHWEDQGSMAIGYGPAKGDEKARQVMAKAMSNWYGIDIHSEEILFTVGGAGALHAIVSALKMHTKKEHFRVITPFPYYSLYAENGLNLHPIHVMNNPGYRLNAESLLASIKSAEQLAETDSASPQVLLLCEPNNPLGSVLDKKELAKIAAVLRSYPELVIILDEVYAEMVLDGSKHLSLLALAPDLKERIIVMRSATKALSAAGERMAITLSFNPELMASIVKASVQSCGHAPLSSQMIYAKIMDQFTDVDRIEINNFYRPKVHYVQKRLSEMGASMPDTEYRVDGTFYVLADLNDLLGEPLHPKASEALGKTGKAVTDEDITYNLLFTNSLMIAPLSYFGVQKNKGYFRITCSEKQDVLESLMDRLEDHLKQNRLSKRQELIGAIKNQALLLKKIKSPIDKSRINFDDYFKSREECSDEKTTALKLKEQNEILELNLLELKRLNRAHTFEGNNDAATRIQSAYRGYNARVLVSYLTKEQNDEWLSFVERVSPQPDNELKNYLKKLKKTERLNFEPWKKHLQTKNFWSYSFVFSCLETVLLSRYTLLLLLLVCASSLVISFELGMVGLAVTSAIGLTALGGVAFFSSQPKSKDLNKPSLDSTDCSLNLII